MWENEEIRKVFVQLSSLLWGGVRLKTMRIDTYSPGDVWDRECTYKNIIERQIEKRVSALGVASCQRVNWKRGSWSQMLENSNES